MGILSDEQVARIRKNHSLGSCQIDPRVLHERMTGLMETASRADWRESLLQRAGEVYRNAMTREIPWELDFDHALVLISSPCHYCGILERDRFNGIDRVDSSGTYSLENCVACCRWCNRAKGQNDVEEFRVWLDWIKGAKVREYLGTVFSKDSGL